MDVLLRVLYWLAVFAISLALLVGLVLFLESRDPGAVESAGGGSAHATREAGRAACSRAKTTIRCSAE